MNNWLYPLWFAAGLLAGTWHATWLWRASRRVTLWLPVWGILRQATVAGVLAIAAVAGGLLWAGSGWVMGFAIAAGVRLARSRQP